MLNVSVLYNIMNSDMGMIADFNTFRKALYRVFVRDPELDNLPLKTILNTIPRVDELTDIRAGTPVLLRTELDMPLKDGRVADISRIEASSATIKYCQQKGWKTIIFGHIGRDKNNTVAPVCQTMSNHLRIPIQLIEDWLDEKNGRLQDSFVDIVKSANSGSIFMLQNTRKYAVEQALWEANEDSFSAISKQMYAIGMDIQQRLTTVEINEAIAASNIDFSSSAIPLLMSKIAMGFHITKEMKDYLPKVQNANLVVFSGLKPDKLDDLEGILDRGRLLMIIAAGSLAMPILKARAQISGTDFSMGLAETDFSYKVFIQPKRVEQARRIVQKCEILGVDLVLPVDFVLDNGQINKIIPPGQAQMDIGPESSALVAKKVREYIERNKTRSDPYILFFNGVFGMVEDSRFQEGTRSFIPLLREMTQAGILTYVGGGEGMLALQKYGSINDVTHAFTCGGTVLKSLRNRHIAYLKAMYLQMSEVGDAEH
jgi:phosphoglycerate kinase